MPVSTERHIYDGDIEIGKDVWIPADHLYKHVEIIGGTEQGKTTFLLNILEKMLRPRYPGEVPGILFIDPKGSGCEKILQWKAAGRINRPVWYIDLEEKTIHYNPLSCPAKDPIKISKLVSELWEALCRIKSAGNTDQHTVMKRFVSATLRALIECDLKLTDARWWLTNRQPDRNNLKKFRHEHIERIKDRETYDEWAGNGPPQKMVESSITFFEPFWRDNRLKNMYSADGWEWNVIYPEKPIILVNLHSFLNDEQLAKAVGTIFISGLMIHAYSLKPHSPEIRRWHIIVDDATVYLPEHVGRTMTMTREFKVYWWLLRHQDFEGGLKKAVDLLALTKFIFGEFEDRTVRPHQYYVPNRFQCAHTFGNPPKFVQWLYPVEMPYLKVDVEPEKQEIYSREWYQTKKEPESVAPVRATRPDKKSARPTAGPSRQGS